MNETFKIICCICYMDNKENQTQKHYRCKTDFFPSPAVFFYAVAKGCIFQRLSDFNSDAKLGLGLGAL